ncbi:putative mitochondrial pyruvate dehydrogenase kinase [Tirmania nivea]|nr:putative mitochondrial pyruvate dehydrogenase kinase [Tirmania nivea]
MILRPRPFIRGSAIVTRALAAHSAPLRTPVVCLRRGFSTQDPEIRQPPVDKFATTPPAGNSLSEHAHTASTPGSSDVVALLAAMPLPTLTLQDLVRHGYPPLSPQRLLASARYTRSVLPIRLAKRILALRNLPFIIVSNPHISEIYNNYIYSLRSVLQFPSNHPTTLAEESQFTEMLKDIVKTHSNTIPTLAKGFIECKRYINPEEVESVLERHLRTRIGTRLLAEQHIALHEASVGKGVKKGEKEEGSESGYIGTIDTNMLPSKIISSCSAFVGDICELRYGVRPKLILEGHTKEKFPYIPVHLEYIITELLKNAFRATIESPTLTKTPSDVHESQQDDGNGGDESLPPVIVTLSVSRRERRNGSRGAKVLSIRIRDRGGGIALEVMPSIWKYSFTTFDPERGRYYPPSITSSTTTSTTLSSSTSSYSSSSSSSSSPYAYSDIPNLTGVVDDYSNPMNVNLGMGGGGAIDALNITSDTGTAGGSSIAGLGYGLPLSRAYAEYFGGTLSVQSCFGWGTDVYLLLKGVEVEDI